jgi:tetratricopeptide (TPR) repeat protein
MSSDSTSTGDSAADSVPEPLDLAISPVVRRKLQQCFDHASKLATQEKFDRDYVAALLASCVQGDPGNLVYVDAFLDNLQKKYDNNKKGAKLRGFGNKGAAVKKAASKADWKEVFKLGPEALKTNPWDVVVLRSLAEACEAYAFNEVELRWLKNALDANPKDVDVNRHCAESLARMGQYEQPIVCWHRIEETKKGSAEAAEMISRLTLERNRERAGYARERGEAPVVKPSTRRLAGITRTVTVKPKPSDSTALGDESDGSESPAAPRREIPLTERQKLEQAIREFPLRADNYLKLAELHIAEQRHAEAERLLTKALEISSGDLKARELLEDVQILRMKDQAALAEQRAQDEDTPANRELAARMKTELLQRELALFASRSERYPTDLGLKHELALRLKRAGNYAEAIKLFQEVRENPERKATATLEMGECLQQLRQFPKAQQCYDRSVALAEAGSEFRKLALYRSGVLALGVRDLEKARSRLTELAGLDAAYKDVQARLDKLAALGDTA